MSSDISSSLASSSPISSTLATPLHFDVVIKTESKSGHEHAYCPDGRDSLESGNNEFSGIQGLTPLRKLHELAVWLRSSSLHADIWDDSVGLRLGIDNRTRWSSWFLVIDRAITKQAEIKAFMTDYEAVLGNNRLNAQDWDFLDKARTFLQPFASATLYAEREKSSISQSLPLMDALLARYERNKVHYSQEDHRDLRMVRAIEMGCLVQGFDRKHFQRLLLEWIVEENHSFRVCEQGRLRRIFEYLNPLVKITDANISRTTIRRQVLASYEAHKDKVAAVLQKSPGLIHVSFDGWKSGNRHSLYGVTCFFRDENSKPCKLLYMIRRAIILRPFLEQLVLKHRQQWEQENRSKRTGGIRKSAKEPRICMEENQLMSNDWIVLEQLAKLLGFYEDAVRTLEGDGQLRRRKRGWVGSYGNIWEVIQGFKFLLEVLEKYKQLAYGIPNSEHLRININLG
ncbi:hypothetical protein ACQRIU_006970 [Beauveria bassiana]